MKIAGKEDNFVVEWVLNQDKMHITSICETDYQDRKKSHPLAWPSTYSPLQTCSKDRWSLVKELDSTIRHSEWIPNALGIGAAWLSLLIDSIQKKNKVL